MTALLVLLCVTAAFQAVTAGPCCCRSKGRRAVSERRGTTQGVAAWATRGPSWTLHPWLAAPAPVGAAAFSLYVDPLRKLTWEPAPPLAPAPAPRAIEDLAPTPAPRAIEDLAPAPAPIEDLAPAAPAQAPAQDIEDLAAAAPVQAPAQDIEDLHAEPAVMELAQDGPAPVVQGAHIKITVLSGFVHLRRTGYLDEPVFQKFRAICKAAGEELPDHSWRLERGEKTRRAVDALTALGLAVEGGRSTLAKALGTASDDDALKREELFLLLQAHARGGTVARVGDRRLAEQLGVGIRRVQTLLTQLENQGKVLRKDRGSSRRVITLYRDGDAPGQGMRQLAHLITATSRSTSPGPDQPGNQDVPIIPLSLHDPSSRGPAPRAAAADAVPGRRAAPPPSASGPASPAGPPLAAEATRGPGPSAAGTGGLAVVTSDGGDPGAAGPPAAADATRWPGPSATGEVRAADRGFSDGSDPGAPGRSEPPAAAGPAAPATPPPAAEARPGPGPSATGHDATASGPETALPTRAPASWQTFGQGLIGRLPVAGQWLREVRCLEQDGSRLLLEADERLLTDVQSVLGPRLEADGYAVEWRTRREVLDAAAA